MFKKKIKKDQGVLNIEEEVKPTLEIASISPNAPHLSSIHSELIAPSHLDHHSNSKFIQQNCNQPIINPQNEAKVKDQSKGGKRAKNAQMLYHKDSDEMFENEPKKKLKEQTEATKQKHLISNNTFSRSEEIGSVVHQAFQDINYKAGKNLIKDMELPADELEQQLAKNKFLENVQATRLIKQGKLNTKIYRGINSYANHKLTNNDIQTAEEAFKKKMGPSRLNSTIKNSCRFDYVLNLCKDWHDSGYCPFGNSCLYLHDRSNYKTGWELQKQFEQAERERWKRINNPELTKRQDHQKLLKTIEKFKPQQICAYCQKDLQKPVEVECGHIFCTSCAVKLLKCKECNKRLSGIMNEATDKLQKQKKDYAEMMSKLEEREQEVLTQRRKFKNTDSLDVFAD